MLSLFRLDDKSLNVLEFEHEYAYDHEYAFMYRCCGGPATVSTCIYTWTCIDEWDEHDECDFFFYMWYECDDEHVDAVWCGLLPCMLVALMYMIWCDECGHAC